MLSIIATALALSFMSLDEIILSESGEIGYITGYLNGYWCWLASISLLSLVLLIDFILNIIKNKKSLDN